MGNPVPAGTSVNFHRGRRSDRRRGPDDAGERLSSTTVNFQSASPRPNDQRVTIVAYAIGEESFLDTNGNNIYDNNEDFQDLGDVFVSRAFSATFDPTLDQRIPQTLTAVKTCVNATSPLLLLDATAPSASVFGGASRCDGGLGIGFRQAGDRNKAKQVAQQYGIAPKNLYNYQNYDSLKDNPDVDIIYIVLPNSMHAEYTVRGAQAGKHILCEKPMANSVKECQQMIDACSAANRRLMIAYRIQYEPHNRLMMQMARGRELGAIKLIEMVNGQNQGGDLNQWRLKKVLAGGGSLPDVGIYCLNTARFLTGEEPIEISASQYSAPGDPRFKEVEETVTWTMRFPSGIQVNAASSYGFHETRRYRVLGSDAWAEMSPAFPYKGLRLTVGRVHAAPPLFEAKEERMLDEKNHFALEMDHIAECVQENKKPFTPGEEGLQDMRLIAAIYEAAQTGRRIALPPQTGMDLYRGPQPTMA